MKEAREWLKKQLYDHEYLFADETIDQMNKLFNCNIKNSLSLVDQYGELFIHDRRTRTVPVVNCRRILIKSDKIEEVEFIKSYIANGQYTVSEYVKIHNEHFNTSYTDETFLSYFKNLFKKYGSCANLLSKKINDKIVTILELPDNTNKEAAFSVFIDNNTFEIPKGLTLKNKETYVRKHMHDIMNDFNKYFHRYESARTFNTLLERIGYVV